MGAASYFNQRLKIYHDAKFHASSMLYIMMTKMTKMLSFYHSRHSRHLRQNCGQMMKKLYKNDKIHAQIEIEMCVNPLHVLHH